MSQDIPNELKNLGKLMEIGTRNPSLLKVASTNNRTVSISDKEKLELRTSVQNIGIVEPIIINNKEEIVSGQLRWAAALAANIAEVPVIKIDFKDKFSERIASIIQDYLHHSLEISDKGKFVDKCIVEDNRTYKDIADSLGVDEHTVRQWHRWNEIPEVIKDNVKLKQTYFDLSGKKRGAVSSVLNSKDFKNSPERSTQYMEYATKASLRDLQTGRKDAKSGTPIDPIARTKRLDEDTVLMEVKIPRYLDTAFRKVLREKELDYIEVLVALIQNYVRTKECPME